MNSSTDFSADQLSAARNTAWHQDGRSLVTIESARNWIDHYGFVLFAPRAAQLGAPAPSFVETTLGAANDSPSAAETATARSLVARLVAEGSVIPLNLLGTPGDLPDFLASAKTFPYVFTMRGDKGWKKAPQTTGATKVSTLALKVFETLTEKGAMSAGELASELGREVTEAAIARALGELWQQLRVIPQLQLAEDAPTLWELLSTRFVKAMKAGANAGQPTAMSALMSLYLSQAVAATEEEVASFLSPLTARSKVREVVHALIAGRQLTATAVEGKTLLHVAGDLPEFAPTPKAEGEAEEGADADTDAPAPKKVGTGRIGKFAAGADAKPRTDFKGKPTRAASEDKAGPARKYGTGKERAYSPRPDTNRRPFTRKPDSDGKPSFTKPWDEEKRPRRADSGGADGTSGDFRASAASSERKPYERKPYAPREGAGGAERPRRTFGDKPSFGAKKPFGDRKPFTPREGGDDRPRRTFGAKPSFGSKPSFGGDRPYKPRREEGSSAGYSPRPSFPKREGSTAPRSYERPAFGDRKPFGDKPAYGAKKPFGDRKPFVPREGGDDRPRRTFGDKPSFGSRPSFGARKPFGERKPFTPREGGDDRPRRSFGDKPSFGSKPGGFGAKPSFGARKPSFGAKPAGGSRGPSKFGGPKTFGGGKFGAKPGRPSARPDGAAPRRKRDEE